MAIFLKKNDNSKHLPLDMAFLKIHTICSIINMLSYKLEEKLVPCNFDFYIIQKLHECSFLMLTSTLNLHQTVYPSFPWLCHFVQNFYYASEDVLLVNYIKSIQKKKNFLKGIFFICPKDYLTKLGLLYPFDGQFQLSQINKRVTVQNISNIVLF